MYNEELQNDTLEEMTYSMKQKYYEQDKIVFRWKDKIDKMYFIHSGKVEIYVEVKNKEILFDTLYQGCIIGLYGILGDQCHMFTCRAKTNAHLYYITQESFRGMLNTLGDLDSVAKKTKQYITENGYPLIDYKIYYSFSNEISK